MQIAEVLERRDRREEEEKRRKDRRNDDMHRRLVLTPSPFFIGQCDDVDDPEWQTVEILCQWNKYSRRSDLLLTLLLFEL